MCSVSISYEDTRSTGLGLLHFGMVFSKSYIKTKSSMQQYRNVARLGLSQALRRSDVVRLASQWVPWDPFAFPSPELRLQMLAGMLFTSVQRSQAQVLVSVEKALCQLSHWATPPSPPPFALRVSLLDGTFQSHLGNKDQALTLH